MHLKCIIKDNFFANRSQPRSLVPKSNTQFILKWFNKNRILALLRFSISPYIFLAMAQAHYIHSKCKSAQQLLKYKRQFNWALYLVPCVSGKMAKGSNINTDIIHVFCYFFLNAHCWSPNYLTNPTIKTEKVKSKLPHTRMRTRRFVYVKSTLAKWIQLKVLNTAKKTFWSQQCSSN